MENTCTYVPSGKVKGILLVKIPSKYLVKKYGYDTAEKMMLRKALNIKSK